MNRFYSRISLITGVLTFCFLTCFLQRSVYSQDTSSNNAGKTVYVLPIRDEITPGMARQVSAGLKEATNLNADLVVIHMNTYGGLLDAADSIRTRLLNSEIPVVSFIDNNAASAGALISIACERIYMREGASIGAATVVNQSAEALPDKYQSYMRSMMRSTAEQRGRDPRIAEAMVDPSIVVPGVSDSGKVLTFTTQEAITNEYCQGQAHDLRSVMKLEGLENASIVTYAPTFLEKMIGFLVNPAISGVLLLIIMGGIYFELQTPGIGFPLLAAVVAALLYFAPLYLEGLAANWEILITMAGFILIAIEVFAIPGFGIAGVSGIILMVTGFTFSLIGNDGFDFSPVPDRELIWSLAVVVASMFGGLFVSYFVAKRILKTTRFNKLVLTNEMSAKQGYVSSDPGLSLLIGQTGTTGSYLRPSGKVIIDDTVYNASADRGFIPKGETVEVVKYDGLTLWVRIKK